jgi:CheY-like chemotaxis protein
MSGPGPGLSGEAETASARARPDRTVAPPGEASLGRVLLAEDDPLIADVVGSVLGEAGYEVIAAPDGAAALAEVRARRPNLVLLDLRMPGLDGFAFARAYRDLPGPHAPLVLLTTSNDAEEHALALGAATWLSKPFDIDELVAAVDRHVGWRAG